MGDTVIIKTFFVMPWRYLMIFFFNRKYIRASRDASGNLMISINYGHPWCAHIFQPKLSSEYTCAYYTKHDKNMVFEKLIYQNLYNSDNPVYYTLERSLRELERMKLLDCGEFEVDFVLK